MKNLKNSIQSINRAFDILESFTNGRRDLRITDMSKNLRLHKSTVHRLLSTLEYRGYIHQDTETGKYQLGLKILELNNSLLQQMQLREKTHPFLERLANQSCETVHLLILDNEEAVYIDKVEYPHTIQLQSYLGKHIPLHATASGKLLLANLAKEEINSIIKKKKLTRYTKNTITSPALLKKELRKIKKQDYSLDNVEYEENVRCIATSIRDFSGKVIAALSISGPTMRIKPKRIPFLIKSAQETGIEISKSLGYDQFKEKL
ncbi:MAG: IclR family transcriptional regulator [Candidatus Omnitrophica bacterium]|nr:IclR family transcriptional regulator [Candidatus Omnitrophota bacterium]